MAPASMRLSEAVAFAASGGRLRSAGSATARGIAKGASSSPAKRPAMRLSMSTAAAPVARRNCGFSSAARRGASTAAKHSAETCSPASLRRRVSAEAAPSLVRPCSSRNEASSPVTGFPGRRRGSSPAHRPSLSPLGLRPREFGKSTLEGRRAASDQHAISSGQN